MSAARYRNCERNWIFARPFLCSRTVDLDHHWHITVGDPLRNFNVDLIETRTAQSRVEDIGWNNPGQFAGELSNFRRSVRTSCCRRGRPSLQVVRFALLDKQGEVDCHHTGSYGRQPMRGRPWSFEEQNRLLIRHVGVSAGHVRLGPERTTERPQFR